LTVNSSINDWIYTGRGSKNIFKLQKKVIRLIKNVVKTASCRDLFKTLNILHSHIYTHRVFKMIVRV
jgi:hypothetical protein